MTITEAEKREPKWQRINREQYEEQQRQQRGEVVEIPLTPEQKKALGFTGSTGAAKEE